MKGIIMKTISFIHAADLHLDSPMVGLTKLPKNIYERIRESTFTALKKITAAAIQYQVDFVIFAGDLFDGEDRSLRAQSRFRTEMQKLAEREIPVYVVHGNHDHLNGSWIHLDLPENVHVFSREIECKVLETKRGERIHLYGFSYPQRHVFERKIEDYRKVEGADFHIGILHGNEGGGKDHANYAPFTVKDMTGKGFDYWALGHIHKRTILSENPPVVYPGNIQGRNKKETGAKGVYHVTLTEAGTSLEFIETSDIVWEEAVIDLSAARNFDEVYKQCLSAMSRLRKNKNGALLTLFLKNVQLDDAREQSSINTQLLDLLLDEEKDEEAFIWIVDLILSVNQEIDKERLKTEAKFFSELFETVDHYQNTSQALTQLYEHHIARKYLSPLTPANEKELIEKAERLLINLLYQN